MKSILTGSSGFVGTHLLQKLQGDVITIPYKYIQSVKIEPFDYFYFLSSYGNMHDQQADEKIFQSNVLDLAAILFLIKDIKFRSFVFISTSSVKLRTQTMYSRMKKAAEEILLSFMEKYDLPICIVRPLSITGVGEQKEHLIPKLIDAALTGKQVNLVPSPTHDFIDVEDLVAGLLSLSQHGARGIFELGTGVKYTNQQVKELVEKITGKEIKVNIIDSMRFYDNQEWVSTNFRARGFGWLPKKTLEQSIQEQVNAYAK